MYIENHAGDTTKGTLQVPMSESIAEDRVCKKTFLARPNLQRTQQHQQQQQSGHQNNPIIEYRQFAVMNHRGVTLSETHCSKRQLQNQSSLLAENSPIDQTNHQTSANIPCSHQK